MFKITTIIIHFHIRFCIVDSVYYKYSFEKVIYLSNENYENYNKILKIKNISATRFWYSRDIKVCHGTWIGKHWCNE